MPVTEHETGTKTTTDTTEHVLNTTTPETTDGAFQFVVDLSDMVRGDVLELRVKEKARSGDTQRQAVLWTFANEQDDKLFISPAMILLHGWDFTLKQTVGAATFLWSIRKVA